MELYYAPALAEGTHTLPPEESYHCVKVLRRKEGNRIHIVDGLGGLYEAEISSAHKDHCNFTVLQAQREYGKRPFHLHMAVAPTKNIERVEWLLEKATELGIDEITPVICERSERRKINHERLQNILVSAMKQSVKAYLPRLNELTDWKDFLKQTDSATAQRFICHLDKDNPTHLKTAYEKGRDALILIGPEGDFTEKELEAAFSHQFKPVVLGSSRLRTETAALAACHTVNLMNEK